MSDTEPAAVEHAGRVRTGGESEDEDLASKIANVVFKILLGAFGLGIGGLVGLIIGLLTGLISFEC